MDSFAGYLKKQLKEYIITEQKKGKSLEEIEKALLNFGHKKDVLDEVFDELKREEAGLKSKPPKEEDKKQIYGTQFRKDNGNMVPYPIEDALNVNKRRKEVGLGTLEDYMIQMNKR